MTTLIDFNPGDQVKVVSTQQLERSYRHQLATLGVKRDKIVMIRQVAPLGDPICIEIDGALLALRKAECEGIIVERI